MVESTTEEIKLDPQILQQVANQTPKPQNPKTPKPRLRVH